MAKGFKLRISKLITSFQSCRSKHPSTLPLDPIPSFSRSKFITVNFSRYSPPSKHYSYYSSIARHVPSSFVSVGCGFTSKPGAKKPFHNDRSGSPHFKWEKEEKWHVVANIYEDTPRRKIYNSSASGDSDDDLSALPTPPPPPPPPEKRKKRPKKKRHRKSTSSADHIRWFSSDERITEETETLVSSSRSFSTDSTSEFNPRLETIREAPTMISRSRHAKKLSKRSVSSPSTENETPTPARLSMFKKLMACSLEGKVKESFAIMKRSENPYEDFKKSMMEMIIEKQMFENEDLEELLHCFLSLNAKCYHGLIIEAFYDICKALLYA